MKKNGENTATRGARRALGTCACAAALACAVAVAAVAAGAAGCAKDPFAGNREGGGMAQEMPGALVAVTYERGSGSVARANFDIEVTPAEIVTCGFWPEGGAGDFVRKDHVAITPEQWADIERIAVELYPVMHQISTTPPQPGFFEKLFGGGSVSQPLDGGDYSNLAFCFATSGGEETIRFAQTSDRRISTLYALLEELANPMGRDIPWYEAPRTNGIYFTDEPAKCSYQLTPHCDGSGNYRFIAYWREGGQDKHLDVSLPADAFAEPLAFLQPLGLEQCPPGSYKDTRHCTLYISDGTQQSVKLTRAQADVLREFFEEFTAKAMANA